MSKIAFVDLMGAQVIFASCPDNDLHPGEEHWELVIKTEEQLATRRIITAEVARLDRDLLCKLRDAISVELGEVRAPKA